jgi:hypothetical protein
LGTFFHLDGDSQAICGQFGASFGQLLAVFGGFLADSFVDFSVRFLVPFLRSIFDPFFGLRAFCNLLVLRDFFDFEGGF